MTIPPISPESRAWDLFTKLSFVSDERVVSVLAQAIREAENAAYERAAEVLLNGRFLHDEAPPARFAKEAAPAILSLRHKDTP